MDISTVFGTGGVLERSLEDFEQRPQQARMAEAVMDALETGRQLVVEAGTGTGKTLAYLIPAILSRKQVVVSTGTRNLQEQIYFKDIPFLQKHLGEPFSSVMLKGRSNYLCPERLKKFAQTTLFQGAAAHRELEIIHKWAGKTKTGDRSEIKDLPEDSQVWWQVCSTPDFCGQRKCPRVTDCFLARLRRKAEESQVVVVNHHLFFADLAIRGKGAPYGVLPDYAAVIFDEAHQIEEIASQYFGFSVSNFRMEELVRDTVMEVDQAGSKAKAELVKDLDNLDSRIKNFFYEFQGHNDGRFSLNDRKPHPDTAETLLTSLDYLENKTGNLDKMTDGLRSVSARFGMVRAELETLLTADDPDFIFWGETRGRGVFLYASSLDVSGALQEYLYSQAITVFTSATLSAAGEFDYFVDRLGLAEPETLALESPFDYKNQVTIYLPRLPDPYSKDFLDRLAEEGKKVIDLVQGRTLFLFTSFRNMYEVRMRLDEKLKYPILMQGEAPRHLLLERFREEHESILLATASFWQGVDVRGGSLSCVIIDRLPFASPGDPVMAARIERIRKDGGNPFMDYQVPYAVIALKQGLGRLVRHRNDTGIIMLADARITQKSYGKTFLDSLPPAPVVRNFSEIRWGG